MIIATAGHVDHGKTSLVRRLTGVDTDRLAEEKRRGLSINLGYAYLPRSGETPLGFIDVPGHQRFINNMIAGISGIDIGMLVVAADDGPMPQTHEHMDVLQLLGIRRLIIVISKIDRVSRERLIEVRSQVDTLLLLRPWPETDIYAVSNQDGDGIEQLKLRLLDYAKDTQRRSSAGHFRVSIDRAFTTKGAGLVVTGTASTGTVRVGDTLILQPQDVELRVRGIRVHDEDAEQAMAGQRCALNVVGKLEAGTIARGDWLLGKGAASPSHRIDVDISLLASAPFSIKHLSPVKMYIGARRVAGRMALLSAAAENNRLHPGHNCLAQLILESDIACYNGERFLLRDHAENVILGGGTILDPDGPQSGKSRPERIAWLRAMQTHSPVDALGRLVAEHQLVNIEKFRQIWNLRDDEPVELDEVDAHLFTAEGNNWAASHRLWSDADERLLEQVDNWHREHPEQPGIKATDLKAALLNHCESALVMATLSARLQGGELVLREGLISRCGFNPAVSAEDANQWQRLQQLISQGGHRIPLLSELGQQTGLAVPELALQLKKAVKRGDLHRVTDKRYALSGQLHELACALNSLADCGEPITVIAVKSHFGTGRNLTIEILEYFDQIGFTRRHGDARLILDRELPDKLFRR